MRRYITVSTPLLATLAPITRVFATLVSMTRVSMTLVSATLVSATLVSMTLLSVAFISGCGGSATLNIGNTPGPTLPQTPAPTPQPVVQVHGTVLMPNGQVARLPDSLLQRFAATLLPEAAALSGNASPVGAGVDVRLSQLQANG